ncbi:probable 3-deoxy-D-manno-octulosonic acid transferase, mitochondrial isoform X2 [Vitis riparia]|uniref:probable 3-deoxy-D-manno-octulosonic acid transferase, mitochondrial isoform X2 n=1 Tax=Vitis riparia TaxID=96939 RepID=UPI00155B19E2|nr:probable 3-deoxy-D-manno-octulosonic acid transferase, mitochondrial isoform X2 [Vitis riparia]
MIGEKGKLLYNVYRALTYGLSPFLYLHLRFRTLQGIEHPVRWPERLGRPSTSRPPGHLIWFHTASLGEGMAAIPVIKRCIEERPDCTILMTSTTASAFEIITNQLPTGVIYQFAPLDIPAAMDAFLGYWKPNAVMLMECELWPNLILGAARNGIALALLNARMSAKSFSRWSRPVLLPLISLMLSKFSLIVPLSTMQGIRFQLLQAPPYVINFSGDLKYTVEEFDISKRGVQSIEELKVQLAHRRVWMVSSIHRGEEKVQELQKEGLSVALRSRDEKLVSGTSIYVVDTLGELRHFYTLTPIAVIGGSFLPGLTGHNISEAAAAGCAVLTGHHVGHFSDMVLKMQRSNPLSVLQVSAEELEEALSELFSNSEILEARCLAAKQAFQALSSGIVANVWNQLNFNVLRQALC